MIKKIRTAILISGRGSNMKALIQSSKAPDFPAEIVLVISNNQNALGLNFAKENNILTIVIDHKNFHNRQDFEFQLDSEIRKNQVEIICLAGFMRILSSWFVSKWQNKLINIHPSLLPNFKGARAVEDAIEALAKISGCSTHYVSDEIDSGEIIMQAQVEVVDSDDAHSLGQKILLEEHKIYPQTLKIVCNNLLNKNN